MLILTLCIWGHVSELFDHWDNTFKTGKDIEYSTVIVVLVAGAVIAFTHVAAVVIRTFSSTSQQSVFASCALTIPSRTAFISHSPPLPLRI
jgi:hypothetical protein